MLSPLMGLLNVGWQPAVLGGLPLADADGVAVAPVSRWVEPSGKAGSGVRCCAADYPTLEHYVVNRGSWRRGRLRVTGNFSYELGRETRCVY